jgi:hypothetical protein
VIDALLHYHRRGSPPFRSLSALPDEAALGLMPGLYVPGSILWRRFGSPAQYLQARRTVERGLYRQFKDKGGRPRQEHPVYFTVGRPRWAYPAYDDATQAVTDAIEVPVSVLDPAEISFTYPDSILAHFQRESGEFVIPGSGYRGELLTLAEMEALAAREGLPVQGWSPDLPSHLSYYIEAQVWNLEALREYRERLMRRAAPT